MTFVPRVRLFIICAFLLSLAFLVWGAVLQPLLQATDQAVETLHDTRFALTRAEAVLKQRNHISDEKVAAEEREVFRHLLQAHSPAGAIGQLQAIVEPLSRDSSLQLENMLADAVVPSVPLNKISIVLKARGTESALLKLLSSLENHQTLMVIDRLTVIGQESGQAVGSEVPVSLIVEMRVVSYWAPPQMPDGPRT